jgi:hypothetical protein
MPTARLVAGDEERGLGAGHLLDRHLELELDGREWQQMLVELSHELAHIVLERRFHRDRDAHHWPSTGAVQSE